METVKKEKYKGYKIKVKTDDYLIDPRGNDNLGRMVCFHNRYSLGDTHPKPFELELSSDMFNSFEEMETYITRKRNIAAILPLYLYDHSGITMNTTGFSCRWDSGQVGFIYVTKEKAREWYSIKNITKKWREKLAEYLDMEVKEYDKYLCGEAYGFVIKKKGKEIDSCWSYTDDDYCFDEAKAVVDSLTKDLEVVEN